MISNSLTFQRQLWPEKKPIFRSEFEQKGTLYRHYLIFFTKIIELDFLKLSTSCPSLLNPYLFITASSSLKKNFFSKLKCGKDAKDFPNFGIINFVGLNWSWIGIASDLESWMVEFEIEYVEISGIMGWLRTGKSVGIWLGSW